MTKKLRLDLAQKIADLDEQLTAFEERLDRIVARLEWMQIKAAEQRPTLTTEQVWATPPRPRFRFLNGSWPQRDGNTYPKLVQPGFKAAVLDYYESYVRRSPPAKD